MGNPKALSLHWPASLVEHFSQFFADQWDQIIITTLAENRLPVAATGYIISALQTVIDNSTESARLALSSGFSPSWEYPSLFDEPAADHYPETALQTVTDVIQGIIQTDRRDYRGRAGQATLGDYFFASLRTAIKKGVVRNCITNHHAAARHVGETAYYAMLSSGISADTLLHSYAARQLRFPITGKVLTQVAAAFPDNEIREFRRLSIVASDDLPAASINEVILQDCEIGEQAFGHICNGFFEDCELCASAIGHCQQSTFKNCHSFDPAVPATGHQAPPRFDECLFYDAFFDGSDGACELRNCAFSDSDISGLRISRLSGDYADSHFHNCVINSISAHTTLGAISQTSIGNADQVNFAGTLKRVRFTGSLNHCQFGLGNATRLENVIFGDTRYSNVNDFIAHVGSNEHSSAVSSCRFHKGVRFENVAFECLLQDPVFDCSTVGIAGIWGLRSTQTTRDSFQGIHFGVIETGPDSRIAAIIGGSIQSLRGSVRQVTHTLIRQLVATADIETYEVILDPVMRQQWKLLPSPILIGSVDGHIGKVTFMGSGSKGYSIGKVSGQIDEFFPGLTIHQLEVAGKLVFAEQADIEEVLRRGVIGNFNGGQFGVWETHNGQRLLSYYFTPDEYRNRGRIEQLNNIFDDLAG